MDRKSEYKFTEDDENLLQQAIRFVKHRDLCKEPFDGYWQDDDDV